MDSITLVLQPVVPDGQVPFLSGCKTDIYREACETAGTAGADGRPLGNTCCAEARTLLTRAGRWWK
jgi:hypothetical protein